MAHEHKSGLPFAYDRTTGRDEIKGLVFHGERPFIQGAELNDMQIAQRAVHNRFARIVAKDGDRIERASALVDVEQAKVLLTEGRIYVVGDVYPVEEAVLQNVPMQGRVEIGVRLQVKYITHEDDPSLLGLVPGSLAQGEPGAAREVASIIWALADDDQPGDFYTVYTLQDGTILDQTGPSMLEPVMQQLAIYDRHHGHYVVSGCRVTSLGANAGAQEFSIEQGEANISGFKRTRHSALRLAELEDWDETAVPGETHIYTGGASHTFTVHQPPIGMISSILLTKEKTVSVTRGATVNGQDGLPDNSVLEIISIPGYTQGADYIRSGNTVDWAPAGKEPAPGTTYECTYRYRATVTADHHDQAKVTVSGGANGGEIIVAYTTKMPRVDLIGLMENGAPIYIKGVSALTNPLPPLVPADVLPLATVSYDWMAQPIVHNNAVRSAPYQEMWRYFDRILDHDRFIQLNRIRNDFDAREPVAKKGMFVDAFRDDSYRDAGVAQTAAIGNGVLQLAIKPTIHMVDLPAPVMLDYVEEIITTQELKTGCVKINPYANFVPLPASLSLDPAVDFWTVQQTQWASPETININKGTRRSGPLEETSQTDELIAQRNEQAEFLRPIPVRFRIAGFGAGELLVELTFDDLNVMPAAQMEADTDGIVEGEFTIPPKVTSGTKTVRAKGRGGSEASALFTGQGTIEIDVMRRVTTVQHWTRPPVQMERRESQSDPQAQIFAVSEPRQIMGVDFHICKIGDAAKHLLIEQVSTDNGLPTTNIEAQTALSMRQTSIGWVSARYPLPVTTLADRKSAFVIKTDDNEHSISLAKLGGYDASIQKWVSSHPYVVGPRFSSVNAETWTAHQDEALSFRLIAAKFTATTKIVDLGTLDLVRCSDLQIRAAVELPSAQCSVVFELERSNGTIYKLLPYQLLEMTEHISETVQLRAVLKGTQKLSPVLYAPIEVVAGEIMQEATYISRAMSFGSALRLTAYLKCYLPGGSTLKMQYSLNGNAFVELPQTAIEPLNFPQWSERKFEKANLSGQNIRFKIIATGGAAARVLAGDFGAGWF